MPVGEKQRLITEIIARVLEIEPRLEKFDWFINKHTEANFRCHFALIDKIFNSLEGNSVANQNKRGQSLVYDAYFGGNYNFIFEFDEFQHFSSWRLKTLELYPPGLEVNFSIEQWKQLCKTHKDRADGYRRENEASDFDFINGRTAQRAYFDCFRDLLPKLHGLNPTVRINEFEVVNIRENNEKSRDIINQLLITKLPYLL